MDRGDEPARMSPLSCSGGRGEADMPFVSEAEALNCVSLRELARTDVLVTVCGDNVCLVLGEVERGQERGMTQDERPA